MGVEASSIESQPARPERPLRTAALLTAVSAAPFAVAGVVWSGHGGEVDGPELLCPFREATGIPCPLCGGVRAFALAAHGDTAFLDFNAPLVLMAACVLAFGLALTLVALARPRVAATTLDRARSILVAGWLPALVGVTAVLWAWTLTHAGTIAG